MIRISAPRLCGCLTLCVLLFGMLFLSACGSGGAATNGNSQNNSQGSTPTVTMSASATQIAAGGSLSLTVTASNATQVVISDNCDSLTYSLQASGGTQTIQVPSSPGTCTYTATATSATGQTATKTVAITVQASAATTVSMTPSQQVIAAGKSATLLVTVANAASVYVTNNVNNTSTPVPANANGYAVTVTPAQTTTYTVTVTGANQTVTAQATVTVMSVSISASSKAIVANGSTTLTVTGANASQIVISDSTDSNTYNLPGSGGTQTVSPTATTTYTATASNGSVMATATVTITVNATASTALINHVIFLMQENRTFDSYFGMLNPYRQSMTTGSQPWNIGDDGTEYDVDGLTDANGAVGNFPTPTGISNPATNNLSDPVTCPASGSWEGQSCTAGLPLYPATQFSLFKLNTTCVDDMSSDWIGSYGDVNEYDFSTGRKIKMDGFVHIAQNYEDSCNNPTDPTKPYCGSGTLNDDLLGRRAMGYYDQTRLNYYYYMASQFALSDRWFSPVASKSTPNRLATLTGGTTQGLVYDPWQDDNKILSKAGLPPIFGQLHIPTIFGKLAAAGVSWRIYYGLTNGNCTDTDGDCTGSGGKGGPYYPSITFADFTDAAAYLYVPTTPGVCSATTTPSGTAVGDPNNEFCIDTSHIVPTGQYPNGQYFKDIASGVTCQPGQTGNCMPEFAFIEPKYGANDEHPGSGQSILWGQAQVASMVNALMSSPAWNDSVFFLSYDEGGGPFDHVPPVPNHSNDFTYATLNPATNYPDISGIAVNPDTTTLNPTMYFPCQSNGPDGTGTTATPTQHCDLETKGNYSDPGYNSGDAAAVDGFGAQLGFRLPNMVISPFARKHFVSHVPMDHTAIIRFVEDRFIGNQQACGPQSYPINTGCYLTNRDAAQPTMDQLGFFDWSEPWLTPPTPPAAMTDSGNTLCTPGKM